MCQKPTDSEPYKKCLDCNKLFHEGCITGKIASALKSSWKCLKCATGLRLRSKSCDTRESIPVIKSVTKNVKKQLTSVDEEINKQSQSVNAQQVQNGPPPAIVTVNDTEAEPKSPADPLKDAHNPDIQVDTTENVTEMLAAIQHNTQGKSADDGNITLLLVNVVKSLMETNKSVQSELKLLREKIEELETSSSTHEKTLRNYKTVSYDLLDSVRDESKTTNKLFEKRLKEISESNSCILQAVEQVTIKYKTNNNERRDTKRDEKNKRHENDNNDANQTNVFIKGIPRNLTASSLFNYFGSYGPIESHIIIQQRKVAFINYRRSADAAQAIKNMNHFNLEGQKISCELSTNKFIMNAQTNTMNFQARDSGHWKKSQNRQKPFKENQFDHRESRQTHQRSRQYDRNRTSRSESGQSANHVNKETSYQEDQQLQHAITQQGDVQQTQAWTQFPQMQHQFVAATLHQIQPYIVNPHWAGPLHQQSMPMIMPNYVRS